MLAVVAVTRWQFLLGLCAAEGLPGGPCHLCNRRIPVRGFDSFESGSTRPMKSLCHLTPTGTSKQDCDFTCPSVLRG